MSATEGEGRFDLPYLAEIFGELSRGRHLCGEDGRLYQELQEQEAAFEELFDRLGYRLQADERGFYYFQAQEAQSVSAQTRRSAVFFLILVEALWADEGGAEPLEDLVMERSWSVADLPHLGRERYVEIMEQLDKAPDEDVLRDEVKRLVRFGFAAWNDDERFRFRAPALRFLDIAREVAAGLQAEDAGARVAEEVRA